MLREGRDDAFRCTTASSEGRQFSEAEFFSAFLVWTSSLKQKNENQTIRKENEPSIPQLPPFPRHFVRSENVGASIDRGQSRRTSRTRLTIIAQSFFFWKNVNNSRMCEMVIKQIQETFSLVRNCEQKQTSENSLAIIRALNRWVKDREGR